MNLVDHLRTLGLKLPPDRPWQHDGRVKAFLRKLALKGHRVSPEHQTPNQQARYARIRERADRAAAGLRGTPR